MAAMAVIPSAQTQWSTFVLSYAAVVYAYYAIAPHFRPPKQNAWIITTICSCIMTVASVPFVWDYLAARGDVKAVRAFPELAVSSSRFFQAYLLADLSVGAVHYRDQLNIATGWCHHIVYLGIVEYAIHQKWAYVFSFATCMEFPTFILGLSTLFPRLRSNILFAVSFFLTRILFHIVICVTYYIPKNRPIAPLTPLTPLTPHTSSMFMPSSSPPQIGSVVPAVLLTCVFPLHASWFLGCLKGFKRRANLKKETKRKEPAVLVPVQHPTPNPSSNLTPPNLYTNYAHYTNYYSLRYAHYSSRYAHYRARLRGLGLRGLRGLRGFRGSASSVREQVRKRIPLERLPSLERLSLERLPSLENLPLIPIPSLSLAGLPSPKDLDFGFGFELPSRERVYGSVGLGRGRSRQKGASMEEMEVQPCSS